MVPSSPGVSRAFSAHRNRSAENLQIHYTYCKALCYCTVSTVGVVVCCTVPRSNHRPQSDTWGWETSYCANMSAFECSTTRRLGKVAKPVRLSLSRYRNVSTQACSADRTVKQGQFNTRNTAAFFLPTRSCAMYLHYVNHGQCKRDLKVQYFRGCVCVCVCVRVFHPHHQALVLFLRVWFTMIRSVGSQKHTRTSRKPRCVPQQPLRGSPANDAMLVMSSGFRYSAVHLDQTCASRICIVTAWVPVASHVVRDSLWFLTFVLNQPHFLKPFNQVTDEEARSRAFIGCYCPATCEPCSAASREQAACISSKGDRRARCCSRPLEKTVR